MNKTLALHLFPTKSITRDAALILSAAILTALCSQVSIPWIPVPFTLQTFAVLLTAFALGSRRGVLAQLAYIGAGACGLPVFAGWAGGIGHVFGPTGGYLLGFIAASWIVGRLAEKGWDKKVALSLAAMVLGNLAIYACGVAWLSAMIGFDKAMMAGMVPFLLGDAIKILAASAALPAAWKAIR
jgi:biotin transport system substrate-specific component